MTRIGLKDDAKSAITKMCDGNPGAIRVMCELVQTARDTDPDGSMMLGGFGPLLDLDTLGLYGSRVWMLYKDVAGEDIRVTHALLRANQLGFVSATALRSAIDNMGEGIDVPALVAQVEERLPNFKKADGGQHGS